MLVALLSFSVEPSYPLQTGINLREDIQVLIAVRQAIYAERRYFSCRLLITEEAEALTQISGHGGTDLSPPMSTLNRYETINTVSSATAAGVVLPAGHSIVTQSSSFHVSTVTMQTTHSPASPTPVGRYRPSNVPSNYATLSSSNNNDALSTAYSSCPLGNINGVEGQLKPYATYAGTVALMTKMSVGISK